MDKNGEKFFVIPCDCHCCSLLIEKKVWEDGDIDYNISVVDSRYDHKVNGIFNRIRRAFGVLFSKPVYFNDVFINGDERFDKIIDQLTELRDWMPAPKLATMPKPVTEATDTPTEDTPVSEDTVIQDAETATEEETVQDDESDTADTTDSPKEETEETD